MDEVRRDGELGRGSCLGAQSFDCYGGVAKDTSVNGVWGFTLQEGPDEALRARGGPLTARAGEGRAA